MAKARLYFDGDNTYIEKQARIYKMVDEIGDKIDNIPGVINNLSSTSETDALSAAMGKELQDQINAMSGNFHFLSSWDCTTGLPGSDPAVDPYVYQSGDYYIVSNTGSTNYKPHGSSYTHGVASTAVETQPVQMNDWYVYDGSTWILQPSGGAQIVIDTALSTTSTNPVENRVITQALNNKQNTIANLSAIESGAAAGATALQPGANITQLTNNAGYQTAGDVASAISGKQDVLTAGKGIDITNNVITNTGITCLTGGDDIEVVQGGTHGIPTGYTELEYISLSGSQYIPTGLSYASGHTYSVHQRILFNVSGNNTKGSGWNAGGAIYVSSTTLGDGSLGSNLGPTGGVADVFIEIGNGTSDYTSTVGGVTRTSSRANTALSDYAGMNYPLGAMSGTGGGLQSNSNMSGNIYFFEYTDGNDRGEYYPVQRDSDDVLGMYDVVGGTFYPVSGTGAVAGPEAADCTTVNFTNASGYMLKSSNKLIYATTSTAFNTRDKVCTTADGNYTPREGDVLALTFNSGCGVGSPRLDIDGSGLHDVSISTIGANASTFWLGMNKITWLFVYDGSKWITWPVKDTTYSAGTGLSLSSGTFSNTQPGPTIGTTAPSSPTEGAMRYDTTNHVLKVYDGSQWVEVGSGGGGGSTTWGNIGGVLSNQTDLQAALDEKLEATDLIAGDGINITQGGNIVVPSGYTQIEYIESHGTEYLDLGVGSCIGQFELDGQLTELGSTSVTMLGARDAGQYYKVVLARSSSDNCFYTLCGSAGQNLNGASDNTSRHMFIVTNTNNGQTIKVDYSEANRSYNVTTTETNNLYLFARNNQGTVSNAASMRAYSLKITNANGQVVRNMFPAKRDSDSVLGMYDIINDVFYVNQGTGTFTGGPEIAAAGVAISLDDTVWTNNNVEAGTGITIDTGTSARLPSGYTELEYVEADGNQMVELGISGNCNFNFDAAGTVSQASTSCVLLDSSGTGNVGTWFGGFTSNGMLWYQTTIPFTTRVSGSLSFRGNVAEGNINGQTFTRTGQNGTTQGDWTLFLNNPPAGSTATYPGYFRLYSLRAEQSATTVLDLVPAKRDSDDVVGLYDLVNDNFLTSASGYSALIGGPEVVFDPTNVISSTVLGFNNLTYDSMTMGTWSSTILSDLTFPSTAKMAFLNWRARDNTNTDLVYACGQVLIIRGLTLVSSFVGGGDGTNYIYGGVGLDSTNSYINYTQGGRTSNAVMDYTIYFYK